MGFETETTFVLLSFIVLLISSVFRSKKINGPLPRTRHHVSILPISTYPLNNNNNNNNFLKKKNWWPVKWSLGMEENPICKWVARKSHPWCLLEWVAR
jgi:hypothetical protein